MFFGDVLYLKKIEKDVISEKYPQYVWTLCDFCDTHIHRVGTAVVGDISLLVVTIYILRRWKSGL